MGPAWQYYDLILAGIPASLFVGAAVGALTAVPFTLAVPSAAGAATILISHALFVNGPTDRPRRDPDGGERADRADRSD